MFAARLAGDCGVADVARAARSPELATASSLAELLLDGFVTRFTDGYAAGVPVLRRAVDAALTSPAEQTRWLWLAGIAALDLWDDESWALLSANHVRIARTAGALTELPLALSTRAIMLQFAGELTEAETLVQELQTVTEATGAGLAPYGALMLAAYRGEQTEVAALTDATARDVTRRGEGVGLTVAERAVAVLSNGIGDYKTALAAAKRAVEHPADLGASPFACVEMIEAAVRCGSSDDALETLDQLTEMTRATGTDWALGIEARSRALLSDTGEAEELYRAAIERLGATRMRTELARAHLLYGEWLRRQRRRIDARVQLRTAHSMLDAMGMEAFAERAGRELRATGETARKRSAAATGKHLTAQEVQIARLARDGLSNPEIGARLFISARTVQYHLRKVFTKLDIRSRSQLDRVL